MEGIFKISIRYTGERKYRDYATGCSLANLRRLCAEACGLAEVCNIRITELPNPVKFKLFTL